MIRYSIKSIVTGADVGMVDSETGAATRLHARHGSQWLSLAARRLLRHLLHEATGIAEDEWRIVKDESGKPRAIADRGGAPPDVSLSHSGDWVAAAMSTVGPVGIDIECRRPGRDIVGIAEAAFGIGERATVGQGGDDAFYRIWTLREAMAKADGIGLPRVVDRQDRVAAAPASRSWTAMVEDRRWLFLHDRPSAVVTLALAVAPIPPLDHWPDGLPLRID